MGSALSPEQRELQSVVRQLLERSSDSAALRAAMDSECGYDTGQWARLAGEVGAAALAVPEEFGGAGASPLEPMLVLEELGRALAPSPLLGSGVLATQALLRSGDREACARLLPGLASGERTAALVWAGHDGGWRPDSSPITARLSSDGGWSLTGRAHYVLDGDTAGYLVVAAHTDRGLALFLTEPEQDGVRRRPVNGMDLTRRLATVSLDGCRGRLLGKDGAGERVLGRVRDIGCAALAMEQVGAAARCLDLTVDYVKQRVQFGRPIGSFQAVKHRLADLYVRVETARSAAHAAAWATAHRDGDASGDDDGGGDGGARIDGGTRRGADDGTANDGADEGTANGDAGGAGDLGHWAALAKVECSEALFAVAAEAVQLHGGIAITWEHDAQLYLKRAHGSMQLFGQPREHVARLAVSLLD